MDVNANFCCAIERYEFKFIFIIRGRILFEVLQSIQVQELANSALISSICSEDTTVCFPTFTFLFRKGLKSISDIYCSSQKIHTVHLKIQPLSILLI